MAKILTDEEMGQIIYDATHDPSLIDEADSYGHFLEDLAELICSHFGGQRGAVGAPDFPDDPEDLGWTCVFRVNECVPSDGGVFKSYDTDVTWRDGEETQA